MDLRYGLPIRSSTLTFSPFVVLSYTPLNLLTRSLCTGIEPDSICLVCAPSSPHLACSFGLEAALGGADLLHNVHDHEQNLPYQN